MRVKTVFESKQLCRPRVGHIELLTGGMRLIGQVERTAELRSKTDQLARLQEFVYSSEQAYILELGAGYMRFFKDRGQIVTAATSATCSRGTGRLHRRHGRTST